MRFLTGEVRLSTHLRNIEGMEMEGKLPDARLSSSPLKVVSPFEPSGDQPEAIAALAKGVEDDLRYQTLLGVTGSARPSRWRRSSKRCRSPR